MMVMIKRFNDGGYDGNEFFRHKLGFWVMKMIMAIIILQAFWVNYILNPNTLIKISHYTTHFELC